MINSGTLLLVGLALLALAGLVLLLLMRASAAGGSMQERIQTYATLPDLNPRQQSGRRNAQFNRLRRRLNAMLSMIGSEELNQQMMAANWRITVTEYILIRIGLMVAGLLIGWVIFGTPLSGLALAIVANLVPGVLLKRAVSRRQVQFENQLVDVLVLIQGAVRAGFSLLQAIEVVEREMTPPATEEFRRVHTEISLGLTLSQALTNMGERMQNADLNLIVTAVNIHNQVGGNLSTMLTAVTETVRDRDRLFREARVLTTQQRYTSYMISLLPVVIGALIFMINPDFITQMFKPDIYIVIPIFAIVGIILGHVVLQRITKIEV